MSPTFHRRSQVSYKEITHFTKDHGEPETSHCLPSEPVHMVNNRHGSKAQNSSTQLGGTTYPLGHCYCVSYIASFSIVWGHGCRVHMGILFLKP
jgi:hypothetical protein